MMLSYIENQRNENRAKEKVSDALSNTRSAREKDYPIRQVGLKWEGTEYQTKEETARSTGKSKGPRHTRSDLI